MTTALVNNSRRNLQSLIALVVSLVAIAAAVAAFAVASTTSATHTPSAKTSTHQPVAGNPLGSVHSDGCRYFATFKLC